MSTKDSEQPVQERLAALEAAVAALTERLDSLASLGGCCA